MTRSEMEALEFWQTSTAGIAERKLDDLERTIDDLSTLTSNRGGVRTLVANRPRLVEAMRKLHDIYLDTQPVEKVA